MQKRIDDDDVIEVKKDRSALKKEKREKQTEEEKELKKEKKLTKKRVWLVAWLNFNLLINFGVFRNARKSKQSRSAGRTKKRSPKSHITMEMMI